MMPDVRKQFKLVKKKVKAVPQEEKKAVIWKEMLDELSETK